MSDDEAKIEALENSFTAAFNARDVNATMKVYVPDASLVVFNVVLRVGQGRHFEPRIKLKGTTTA